MKRGYNSMIEWPDLLIDAIARRRCVLFLGSGISANAKNIDGKKPPTWAEFLKTVLIKEEKKLKNVKELLGQLINIGDFLMACEVIINNIGEHAFNEAVADEFRRPGYKHSDVHKLIFGLDSRIVVTPNVDKIYEQYALHESNSTIVVKSYYDNDIAKYIRSKDYLLIREHGYVDDANKMIFTQKQYNIARCQYRTFYDLMDALILTHTFIFLGCGINDPDIKLVLENSNFSHCGCNPHYFVTEKDGFELEIAKVLCSNRNLEFLEYDNSDGTHSRLIENLKKLNEIVDYERKTISDQQSW